MNNSGFIMGIAFGLGIISIPSPKDLFYIKFCVLRKNILPLALIAVASDAILIATGALLFGITGSNITFGIIVRLMSIFYIIYLVRPEQSVSR